MVEYFFNNWPLCKEQMAMPFFKKTDHCVRKGWTCHLKNWLLCTEGEPMPFFQKNGLVCKKGMDMPFKKLSSVQGSYSHAIFQKTDHCAGKRWPRHLKKWLLCKKGWPCHLKNWPLCKEVMAKYFLITDHCVRNRWPCHFSKKWSLC